MSDSSPSEDEFDSLIYEAAERGSVADQSFDGQINAAPTGIVEFNERAYLSAYPDAQMMLDANQFGSAVEHYERVGKAEHRLATQAYLEALASGRERPSHGQVSFNLDVVIASTNGTVFLVGWSDDRSSPLLSVSIIQGDEGWNTGRSHVAADWMSSPCWEPRQDISLGFGPRISWLASMARRRALCCGHDLETAALPRPN